MFNTIQYNNTIVEWLCSLPDMSCSVVQVCLELVLLDHRLSRSRDTRVPRNPKKGDLLCFREHSWIFEIMCVGQVLLSTCKADFESEHMITLLRFWRTQTWTAARSAVASAVKK